MNSASVLCEMAKTFGAGGWTRLRQLVSDDLVCIEIASDGETAVAEDEFVRFGRSWRDAFSGFECEILAVVGDSSHAAGDFVLRGTHTGPMPTPWGDIAATGRRVELPFAMFCEVADGKITVIRDHYNPTLAMSQIGIEPGGFRE